MTGREFTGTYGQAVELSTHPGMRGHETTIAWRLLTGRAWHPVWPQFSLSVVHLRPMPGAPDPVLHFPGATHELMVVALNPKDSANPVFPDLHSAASFESGGFRAVGGYLTPFDVVHQFEGTDDELRELAALCAQACCHGWLTPSTDSARAQERERWLTACVRSLAHMRGEVHHA